MYIISSTFRNPLLEKVEQNRFWKKRAKSLLEKASKKV
jgi:hypothetical protein